VVQWDSRLGWLSSKKGLVAVVVAVMLICAHGDEEEGSEEGSRRLREGSRLWYLVD
jgi:hypothetical protein